MLINQHGDPYGNRTRVSAVERENALESKRRPAFPDLFNSFRFNGLREWGDGIHRRYRQINAPAKAATDARANHSIAGDWCGKPTRNRGASQ